MTTPDARREQRDAIDRKRRAAMEQRAEDIKWLMAHAQGRRFVWGWLSDLGLYRTPFSGESVQQTHFNLGAHSTALALNAQVLEHAPDDYDLMAREAREPAK